MTYEEALAYLHSLQRFGMKPGLDRTQDLLHRLGRPDRQAGRIIHITGTSGKGSVAALVESALRASGSRVGLYTSPALERFTERIQIDRREIDPLDLATLVAEVKPHVEAMVAEGHDQPTEFEVTTAIALLYVARQRVDWLVLEVGLGGRFDATTAVDSPAVTCITNIGLDHTDWLGDTHEKIAWDKAGIIKPAVPCVTGSEHPGALEVIREVALSQTAVLEEVSEEDSVVTAFGPEGQLVDLYGARGWYRGVKLRLLGRHQAFNAAVALRLLELAGVQEGAIRDGFSSLSWPGRFELLATPGGPLVVLDGAHNPAKCTALAETVREYFPGRSVSLVLGVLADKEVRAMVSPLLAIAGRVWVTEAESPRRLGAEALAEICRQSGKEPEVLPSVEQAVTQALSHADRDEILLITGSFYTVGPARKSLVAKFGRA